MSLIPVSIKNLEQTETVNDTDLLIIEDGETTHKIEAADLVSHVTDVGKDIFIQLTEKGTVNGVAPLNSSVQIDSQYLNFGMDDGTVYEGSSGKLLEAKVDSHIADTDNPHQVTKEQIGLGNVENKDSATIRGELTAENVIAALGYTPEEDGMYEEAVAYIDKVISDLVGTAPEALDTIYELADAIKENEDVIETLNTLLGEKIDTAGTYLVKDGTTLLHDKSGVTAGSYGDTSAQTPAFGETFKALRETVDAYGHVTAIAEHDVAMPSSVATTSTAGLMSASDKSKLDGISEGATSNSNAIDTAGTGLSKSGTTLNHSNSVTAGTAQGDASKTLEYGGTFTIPTITYDAQGHITGSGTTTMTMPEASGGGSSGSVDGDLYALKEYYGDTYVSVGRKSDTTVGMKSFAFGQNCTASGIYSHAEGYSTASGYGSHAEGRGTADGDYSHAEGNGTTSGSYSHAEGYGTASGDCSHAEGLGATADGDNSHAEGYYTTALYGQHAQGHYNDTSLATAGSFSGTTGTAFVIGNGTLSSSSNAFRITYGGVTYSKGAYNTSGADYAEYFEWADGNPDNEDRRGYFVTTDGDKIAPAGEGDYILGVVSGNPCVIGNGDECWNGQYLRDDFNSLILEMYDEEYEDFARDEDGHVVIDEETGKPKTRKATREVTFYKVSPDYDPSRKYVQRADRPEWDAVGMMGQLAVRDDGTCTVNGYCRCAGGGTATACERGDEGAYRVVKRASENVVMIIFALK